MPTQSEPRTEDSKQTAEWKLSGVEPRRSVFANFQSQIPNPQPADQPPAHKQRETDKRAFAPTPIGTLQNRIDAAMGRVFIYQFLARAFDEPSIETWAWLTDSRTHDSLRAAVLGATLPGTLSQAVTAFLDTATAAGAGAGAWTFLSAAASEREQALDTSGTLEPLGLARLESFQCAYVTAFGHAARGDCPLNEIEYGDLKADPLFQPHRLADLAALCRRTSRPPRHGTGVHGGPDSQGGVRARTPVRF